MDTGLHRELFLDNNPVGYSAAIVFEDETLHSPSCESRQLHVCKRYMTGDPWPRQVQVRECRQSKDHIEIWPKITVVLLRWHAFSVTPSTYSNWAGRRIQN